MARYRHLISLLLLLCQIWVAFTSDDDARSSTVGYGGMVGSDHYLATQAGIKILEKGGNAADAALAVQWVLNVVRPFMTGIGGGCFIVYYDAKSQTVYNIDGREEAPDAYHSQIFCENDACFPQPTDECDCYFSNQTISYPESAWGGLSVGVPGTLYAFYNLHKYFKSGEISWKESFEDAISIAKEGFPMYTQFYNYLYYEPYTALRRFNASLDLYFNTTTMEPIANINETFYNPDLAETFELLSKNGADSAIFEFYNGTLAHEIVETVQNAYNNVTNRWGLMTINDISNYKSVFREPIVSKITEKTHKTNDITDETNEYYMYGMNMPSSGATTQTMMQMLNELNGNDPNLNNLNSYNISNHSIYSSETIHALISLFNIAFADRNYYMADSDFENVPIDGLLNVTYNRLRAEEYLSNYKIDTPIDYGFPKGVLNSNLNNSEYTRDESGTSHFFVVDKDNNIACITTTMEYVFGSSVTVPGRGFGLNNELTDFDAIGFDYIRNETVANGPEGGKRRRRTALNVFDIKHDNATYGGKRPRSSMSPTIVLKKVGNSDDSGGFDMIPVIAVGSPGGKTIIESVFQVLSKVLVWDMDVQLAIDAPRLWSFNTETVDIEPAFWGYNGNLTNELNGLGYNVTEQFVNLSHGSVAAVRFDDSGSGSGSEFLSDKGYYVMYGGVDDQRVLEATVMAVCEGDGTNKKEDESNVICAELSTDIKGLSGLETKVLIALWLVVLVMVVLCVVFRRYVREYSCCWCDKKRRKNKGVDSGSGHSGDANSGGDVSGNGGKIGGNNSGGSGGLKRKNNRSKYEQLGDENEIIDSDGMDNRNGNGNNRINNDELYGVSRKAHLSGDVGSKQSLDNVANKLNRSNNV